MTFAQSLKVVIKQDGKIIEPVNDVYELKKSPFYLKSRLPIWKDF